MYHASITRKLKFFPARGKNPDMSRGGESHRMDLVADSMKLLYSEKLRELVISCLIREPLLRPKAPELQKAVLWGLETALATAQERNDFDINAGRLDIPMAEIIWPDPPTFVDINNVVIPNFALPRNSSSNSGQTKTWTMAKLDKEYNKYRK